VNERYFALMDARKVHYLFHARERYDVLRLRSESVQELCWDDRGRTVRVPCVVLDRKTGHELTVDSARAFIDRVLVARLDESHVKKVSAPIIVANDAVVSPFLFKSVFDPLGDMESTTAFSGSCSVFEVLLSYNRSTSKVILAHGDKGWYILFNAGAAAPHRVIVASFDGRPSNAVEPADFESWVPTTLRVVVLPSSIDYTIIRMKSLGVSSRDGVDDLARELPRMGIIEKAA